MPTTTRASNIPFCHKCGSPTEVVVRREKRYDPRTGERADYDRYWVRCRRLRGVGAILAGIDSAFLGRSGHVDEEASCRG